MIFAVSPSWKQHFNYSTRGSTPTMCSVAGRLSVWLCKWLHTNWNFASLSTWVKNQMCILSGPLPHFFFLKNPPRLSRLSANFPPTTIVGVVLVSYFSQWGGQMSGRKKCWEESFIWAHDSGDAVLHSGVVGWSHLQLGLRTHSCLCRPGMLTSSFPPLFTVEPQSKGWNHPHSTWVFPLGTFS